MENEDDGRNVRIPNIMVAPGSGGLGVVDPGNGGLSPFSTGFKSRNARSSLVEMRCCRIIKVLTSNKTGKIRFSLFPRPVTAGTMSPEMLMELHAHINGSCSDETISKLLKKKQQLNPSYQLHCDLKNPSNTGSLEKCFSKFRIIHELCDNEEAAYLVTSDVIKEFASDNVKYLELRTTPRDVPSTRMTKSSYVESVLKAIEDATSSSSNSSCDIPVKLLLSIDRSRIEDAEETLKLVEAFSTQSDAVVVGLDLSGHPNAGDIKSLLPVLERARQNRIRMSLHIAEVPGCIEEVEDLISILPDRIGHATFLLPSHMNGRTDLVDKVIAHKIPIELCLTSNIESGSVSDYGSHHFEYWYQRNHPCILCTDDKGVFSTSLSAEYLHAATAFDLTKEQLFKLSYDSIDYIFSDTICKTSLREKWKNFMMANFK